MALTFPEIARCVKHMLYWKKGKLIYPINVNNIYRISDDAVINKEAAYKFRYIRDSTNLLFIEISLILQYLGYSSTKIKLNQTILFGTS